MFGIGPLELVLILVVALLVFGPKRVPELARTLGRSLAEFRRASNDLRQSLALDDLHDDLRRELSPQQTIHRPRPKVDAATASKDGDAAKPDAEASSAGAGEAAPTKHPGELPLGNDHEHRDLPPDPEEAEPASTAGADAGAETSVNADANARDDSTPDAEPTPDSELGSVPVAEPGPRRKPGRG